MECLAHRIQFYEFKPSPFTCLALSKGNLIAAGRSDGSIDIYDTNRNFVLVTRIPCKVCCSVEALVWVEDRLFCTGALGRLCDIDINSSSIKTFIVLPGSPVSRCLATFKDKIVVGTDEGFVSVFSVDFSVEHNVQTFPKFSGKIVSLACDDSQGGIIAVGTSTGSLLILSIIDGTTKTRFTLGEVGSSCITWCLLFSKGVLFSGDSRGVVSLWNTYVGGLLCSFCCHRADVLTLASNTDGSVVYSAGVDGIIQRFECNILHDGESQWQVSGILRGRRDICGLAFIPGHHYDPGSELSHSDSRIEPHRLLAVGQDARLQIMACEQSELGVEGLSLASYTLACQVGKPRGKANMDMALIAALPYWPISVAPTYPPPITFVSLSDNDVEHYIFPNCTKQNRCMFLMHYPEKLVFGRLGCPISNPSELKNNTNLVSMSLGPYQLAEIRPLKNTELISSTLSRCGKFIAYSDLKRSRLVELNILKSGKKRKFSSSSNLNISIHPVRWQSSMSDQLELKHRGGIDSCELSRNRKLSNSYSSSSETDMSDTDELSHDEILTKYFTLDNDYSSPAEKQCRSNSDDKNESSDCTHLPAAHCVAFTPDSQHLILVTQQEGDLMCVAIKTGRVQWKCSPSEDLSFRVYKLTISELQLDVGNYILCLCCTDGRVRLFTSSNGQSVFTCSCLDSAIGYAPLPITTAFSPFIHSGGDDDDDSSSLIKFRISILYTNNQFREWSFRVKKSPVEQHSSDVDISAKLCKWPVRFWKTMGDEMNETLGLFHSIGYLTPGKWLLSSERFLVLLNSLDGNYEQGMISDMVEKKVNPHSDCCIKLVKDYQGIIQLNVLSQNEFAMVSIHASNIAMMLSAPMQKKRFGT